MSASSPSDKMQKTIVVTINNLVRHPIYGRTVRQSKRFKAHDENNDAHIGDTVEIMETRPAEQREELASHSHCRARQVTHTDE